MRKEIRLNSKIIRLLLLTTVIISFNCEKETTSDSKSQSVPTLQDLYGDAKVYYSKDLNEINEKVNEIFSNLIPKEYYAHEINSTDKNLFILGLGHPDFKSLIPVDILQNIENYNFKEMAIRTWGSGLIETFFKADPLNDMLNYGSTELIFLFHITDKNLNGDFKDYWTFMFTNNLYPDNQSIFSKKMISIYSKLK